MVVYTGGTFDVPHMGHIFFFRSIKRFFPLGKLVVSLNTDEFILRYKGKRPLYTYEERFRFLKSVEYIDSIIENVANEDSRVAIDSVNPNVIAIGNDWLLKDYCKQMGFDKEWLDDRGIVLAYFPHLKGLSATSIKYRLSDVK